MWKCSAFVSLLSAQSLRVCHTVRSTPFGRGTEAETHVSASRDFVHRSELRSPCLKRNQVHGNTGTFRNDEMKSWLYTFFPTSKKPKKSKNTGVLGQTRGNTGEQKIAGSLCSLRSLADYGGFRSARWPCAPTITRTTCLPRRPAGRFPSSLHRCLRHPCLASASGVRTASTVERHYVWRGSCGFRFFREPLREVVGKLRRDSRTHRFGASAAFATSPAHGATPVPMFGCVAMAGCVVAFASVGGRW